MQKGSESNSEPAIFQNSSMKNIKNNRRGFTLIELLVVIAVIGLLAVIALSSLNAAKANARDAKRVADIRSIQTALDLYFVDGDVFPESNPADTPPHTPELIDGTDNMSVELRNKNYLIAVAKDPFSLPNGACGVNDCRFDYESDGTTYRLRFYLETNSVQGRAKGVPHTVTP